MVGELIDQMGVRARRNFGQLQATEEAEPLLGVRDETHTPISAIGYLVSSRAFANPQVGSRTDLLEADFLGSFQMEQVNEYELVLCNETKRTSGAPARGTMNQVA